MVKKKKPECVCAKLCVRVHEDVLAVVVVVVSLCPSVRVCASLCAWEWGQILWRAPQAGRFKSRCMDKCGVVLFFAALRNKRYLLTKKQ